MTKENINLRELLNIQIILFFQIPGHPSAGKLELKSKKPRKIKN